jgi:polyisoprenoid-binding protein YceI
MKRIEAWTLALFPLTVSGVLLGWQAPTDLRASPPAAAVVYRLTSASRFEVRTGKAGVFGFAGHSHLVRALSVSGWVLYPAGNPYESRLQLVIPTDSLAVLTPDDTAEIRKVTETMRTQVLRVAEFPDIRFRATVAGVSGTDFRLEGELTMVGQTRKVPVRASVRIDGDTLHAEGEFSVKQTDFGITPVRAGPGGTVKVADRVKFTFAAIAVRDPAGTIDTAATITQAAR